MPRLLLALLAAALTCCAMTACAPRKNPSPDNAVRAKPGLVSHLVVTYLKKPGDADDRRKVIEATKGLAVIPGVVSIEGGRVIPSTRPIVVGDYDVAMVIRFKDAAAMRAYVTHPLHEKTVKEVLGPLVAKIVVYDFTAE